MITAMIMLTVPSVEARVWSAHADYLSLWHVDIIVDTDADTLKVKWAEPFLGLSYWPFGSYIHVWDDYGHIYWYDAPLHHIIGSGEMTFDYARTYVTVHAEIRWCYDTGFMFGFSVTVRCDLYVSGGWICPTLFVWSGTEFSEEGVLDIHAESDITIQHRIENVLALENGVYNLQLRELDNYISHIDQVKLYAVDYEGEWHLCPLIYAEHNELGKVTWKLRFDDRKRVDLEPTEIIDLKFLPSISYVETDYFTFEINGYNMK